MYCAYHNNNYNPCSYARVDYENVTILVESSHSLIASMCIGDVFLILAFVSLKASCSSAANRPGCVCMTIPQMLYILFGVLSPN